jgi:hypothetical protein
VPRDASAVPRRLARLRLALALALALSALSVAPAGVASAQDGPMGYLEGRIVEIVQRSGSDDVALVQAGGRTIQALIPPDDPDRRHLAAPLPSR